MNRPFRTKTLLRTAALGLSAALALTACGDSDDTAGGDGKTITFVAAEYSTNTAPYWRELIKDFEAANQGLRVDLQVVNWNDIDQRVKTLVQTGEQPDILNLNKFADFAADDLLQPAKDVVSPEVLSDFIPSFADNAEIDGEQYGLPFIASARLFFYNKDLFAKAGITEPPKTWNEVKAGAEKIKALGGGVVGYGLPLGTEEAQAEFQMWANGNGGHWVDDTGKWTINSQQNVQTLNFLTGMVDAKLTQPNPAKTNRTDLFNVFAQGKVGMLNGAVFLPGIIEKQNKNLDYGIAPIPTNGGNPSTTLGVQDFLMAFQNEGNTETVRKFLDFFYSKQNYAKFLTTEGFLPVTTSGSEELKSDAKLKPFIDALPQAKFYPANDPAWTAVDGAVKQTIGTAVQGADPQQVLDRIQQKAEGA
ncbi:MAG: extracellular solute-binding protein [Haloechinothrix sp.]